MAASGGPSTIWNRRKPAVDGGHQSHDEFDPSERRANQSEVRPAFRSGAQRSVLAPLVAAGSLIRESSHGDTLSVKQTA